MTNFIKLNSIAPALPEEDYFTPEARALCARLKHKSDLTDDETFTLALVAAQAGVARYFHPGARWAEKVLDMIRAILNHEDIVAALRRKMASDQNSKEAFERRLEQKE